MLKILPVSGGYDSTMLYLTQKNIDKYVYIDYGQENKSKELKVLKKLKIPYKIIKIKKLKKDNNYFFEARNLKIIMTILDNYNNDIEIYIGTNKEDEYSDNSKAFFRLLEKVLRASYGKKIVIKLPLVTKTKKEIINFVGNKIKTIPWYCDKNKKNPCGKCHSCKAVK